MLTYTLRFSLGLGLWLLLGSSLLRANSAPPFVLQESVQFELTEQGLFTTVQLETRSLEEGSSAFPAASGAGTLVGWQSSPPHSFRMVAPRENSPGAPSFRQLAPGRAELRLTFWRDLSAREDSIQLRLPPRPDGTFSFRGLDPKLRLSYPEGEPFAAEENGVRSGPIPPDGRLWLHWGQARRASRAAQVLEASDFEIQISDSQIRGELLLQGYHSGGPLAVFLPSPKVWKVLGPKAVSLEPPSDEGAATFHGIPPGEFLLRLEAELPTQAGMPRLELRLPRLPGSMIPRHSQIVVEQLESRSLQNPSIAYWKTMRLSKGRIRYLPKTQGKDVSGEPIEYIYFDVFGHAPRPQRSKISRIHVETEKGPEVGSLMYWNSEVRYHLSGPGSLVLTSPLEIEWKDLKIDSKRIPKSNFEMKGEAALVRRQELECDRPCRISLKVSQVTSAAGPVGAVQLEIPRGDLPVDRLDWSFVKPPEWEVYGTLASSHRARGPVFPLSWMMAILLGIWEALTRSIFLFSCVIAFGLSLYATAELRETNRTTVYMLSACIAFAGLTTQGILQGRPAPGSEATPGGISSISPTDDLPQEGLSQNLWSRMQERTHTLFGALTGAPPEDVPPRTPLPPAKETRPKASRVSPAPQGAPLSRSGFGSAPSKASPDSEGRLEIRRHRVEGFAEDPYRLRIPFVATWLPIGIEFLLGLLWIAAAHLYHRKAEPLALAALVFVPCTLLGFDLAFPGRLSYGAIFGALGIFAIVSQRLAQLGLVWKARIQARLREEAERAPVRGKSGYQDDAAYAARYGKRLEPNEVRFSEAFPEDEGIMFFSGEEDA